MPSAVNQQYQKYVKDRLGKERWEHTTGVVECAKRLQSHYEQLTGLPLDRIALLHDNAKNLDKNKQKELADQFLSGMSELDTSLPGLWHAYASGQSMIEDLDFPREHDEVRVVAYHPTGCSPVSPLMKGLLVADFSEPNRSFEKAHELRNRFGNDSLDTLCREVL
ncbi:MAG: hypothetical protein ABEJ65_06375, partial [bacterium]